LLFGNGTSAISENANLTFNTTNNRLQLGQNGSVNGQLVIWNQTASREGNIYGDSTYGIRMDTNSNVRPIRIDGSAFEVSSPATFSSSVTAKDSVTVTGNYPAIQLTATSGTNFYIESTFTSNRLGFGVVGNAPIMALTSGGNVGISETSPSSRLHILATNTSSNFTGVNYPSETSGILLDNQQSTTNVGAFTALTFRVYNTSSNQSASILAVATASGTSPNLVFTQRTGANTNTERMRITSGGVFKASTDGTYDAIGGTANEFNQSVPDWVLVLRNKHATSPFGMFVNYTGASPNNTDSEFLYCRDGGPTLRAAIRSNGGLANYQANNVNLSDERTKKDIIPLESYWDKFKAIEIVKFKYKDQTHDDFNIGVIAQQVKSVAPEFIDVDGWDSKPKLEEDGSEVVSTEEPLMSVYTADLHHATIKVLQEAMAKIETLEAKIAILEAK
jgi:hypothetical protein